MLLSKIMCYYEGELQFCSIFIDVSENLLSTSFYFFHGSGHWSFGTEFFRREIILNYILATFRKTQVYDFCWHYLSNLFLAYDQYICTNDI